MMEVTARVEGHYEVLETPFARDYRWYPAYVTLLCDCGEKLTFWHHHYQQHLIHL